MGNAETYEMITQESVQVFTEIGNLEKLSQTLKIQGFKVTDIGLRWILGNQVEVTDSDQAKSLLKLIDTLEGLDDVQNVTANFDMADGLMELSMI